jgi:hypothetical protein
LATFGWSVNWGALLMKTPELHDALDAVEAPERLAHLGEQHDAARPRGALPVIEVTVLAEPAGHHLSVLERELA